MFPAHLNQRFSNRTLVQERDQVFTWRVEASSGRQIVKVCPSSNSALSRLSELLTSLERTHEFESAHAVDWIVLPYLEGQTLDERLVHGRLSLSETLQLGIDLCRDLESLHKAKAFHGDIKPANVVLSTPARLIDLGFAGFEGSNWGGTPGYLSPEQAGLVRDRQPGTRSDLFSLGVTLYQCISGRMPFEGTTTSDWLAQLAAADPVPLDPPALSAVLLRLLRKDPSERHLSVGELIKDFMQLINGAIPARQPLRRLAAPELVGRRRELDELTRSWENSKVRNQVLCLTAPAGGGKTRLAEEFALETRRKGGRVFKAQGGFHLPWQSLSGLADEVVLSARSDRPWGLRIGERLTTVSAPLLQTLPQLDSMLQAAGEGPLDFSNHATETALTEFLGALSSPKLPTLVILEDQHWSSKATHSLLANLSKQNKNGLMILCTARPQETPADSPLQQLEQMPLKPLSAGEVEDILKSMAGSLPQPVTDTICRQAGGNPFAAQALLHGLVESRALEQKLGQWRHSMSAGAGFSLAATDAVLSRLQNLPEETLQFLKAGAILGRSFRQAEAAELSHSSVSAAGPALERMLLLEQVDRLQFAHDLVRETVLEKITEQERLDFHRQAAEGCRDCFSMALHLSGAGLLQQALPHALAAAEQAMNQYDALLVDVYLDVARQAWEFASNRQRLFVHEMAVECLIRTRRHYEALEECEHGLRLARTPLEIARLWRRKSEVESNCNREVEAGVSAGEALAALGARRGWFRTLSSFRHAYSLLYGMKAKIAGLPHCPEPGPEAEEKVICIFQVLQAAIFDGRMVTGSALFFEGWHIVSSHKPSDVTAMFLLYLSGAFAIFKNGPSELLYAAARPLAEGIHDHRRRGRALCAGAQAKWINGNLQAGLVDLSAARDALHQSGEAFDEITCAAHLTYVYYGLGKFREGKELTQDLGRCASVYGYPWARLLQFFFDALFRWGELELLSQVPVIHPFANSFHHYGSGIVYWRKREFDKAIAEFDASIKLADFHLPKGAWVWRAECYRRKAEVSPFGQSGKAWKAALAAAKKALQAGKRFNLVLPHAHREMALVSLNLGHRANAEHHFQVSLQHAQEYGMPVEEALTRIAQGRLLTESGQHQRRLGFRQLRELGIEHPFEREAEGAPTLSLIDRFDSLLQVGRDLVGSRSVEQIWERLLAGIIKLLRPQEAGLLNLEAGCFLGSPLTPSRQLWKRALETGEVVLHDEQFSLLESVALDQIRSGLLLPIRQGKQLKAVLVAHHSGLAGYFGQEEERIARLLASQASVALENCQYSAANQALLHGTAVGIALCNLNGDIAECNPAMSQRIVGLNSLWDGFEPVRRSRILRRWRSLFSGERNSRTFEAIWAPAGSSAEYLLVNLTRVSGTDLGVVSLLNISPTKTKMLVEFQEVERQLLAGELHDGPAQDLSWLRLQLTDSAHDADEVWAPRVTHWASQSLGILHSIQESMGRLRNPLLEGESVRRGLRSILRRECAGLEARTRLRGRLNQSETAAAHTLLRVVQESARNVRRHSGAGRVWLAIRARRNQIQGYLRDDGKGFDIGQATSRLGLKAMKQRVRLLGGKIRVRSSPSGTRISFTIPSSRQDH